MYEQYIHWHFLLPSVYQGHSKCAQMCMGRFLMAYTCREHTCVYIYIGTGDNNAQVYSPLSSALFFQKKSLKNYKERKNKVTFRKGAYDIRTMQPSWFETVYLREREKKYPDFLKNGSNMFNFVFQREILERNMFLQLLEPNISTFCKKEEKKEKKI